MKNSFSHPQKAFHILGRILTYVFLIVLMLLAIGPFSWVLLSSFKNNAEIINTSLALPKSFSFRNYAKAFEMAPLASFYGHSILVAVFGTLFNLTIVGMAAYVVSRFRFRFKGVVIALISALMMVPGAALLQPLYLTAKNLGFYDKLYGLMIVYAAFGAPQSLYILSSYFLTIPREMEEAAYLDGASFTQTFHRVILPMAKPGFATAGVLQFLLCWNEFQFAMTLTTGNKVRTLPVALYYFKSQFGTDYGVMFAATIIVIIPSIIVFVLLQEWVVSGLAAGAVKG